MNKKNLGADPFEKVHKRFGKTPKLADMGPGWRSVRKEWNELHAKAKRVFDLMDMDVFRQECGLPLPIPIEKYSKFMDDWDKAVKKAIVSNLNRRTLPHLFLIVLANKDAVRGKTAAEALHNKPGGSREKQAEIRKAWASGKYSSKDICAEQECAGFNMSFSSARKALRGAPKPT